jgi:hypothetical protein
VNAGTAEALQTNPAGGHREGAMTDMLDAAFGVDGRVRERAAAKVEVAR